MLLPQHGRFARRLSVADLYREEFTMKLINVAEVVEVVDLNGCGDWGTVEVSMTTHGLRIALGRDVFVLPVLNGMAEVASDPAQRQLLEWIDDMGF